MKLRAEGAIVQGASNWEGYRRGLVTGGAINQRCLRHIACHTDDEPRRRRTVQSSVTFFITTRLHACLVTFT